ncbi:MAG: SpoIIE family protein phosphatase [Phycisphaerae bacterium]|jgi:serine phosphatase RsbU (regulator of sigma subunit)|nr:SpoIIE family protein phosphatase [Phycisphaerae bacterium]MCZ2398660.1 SpoIIE family protein phosphatase [Phycisphaerae bacterium]
MRLVIRTKGEVLGEVACDQEAVYIGSREDCRICLPDAQLSPQSAVVYPEGNQTWVLQLLDAQAPFELNGEVLTEKQTLKTGDEIRISDYTIRAYLDSGAGPAAYRPAGKTTVANMTRYVQYQLPQGALIKKLEEAVTLLAPQMSRLAQLNLKLSQCEQPPEFITGLLQVLIESFAAQRAWVGVRRVNYGSMEYQEGRLLTGQAIDLPETGDKLKPRVLDRGQFVLLPHVSPDEPCSVLTGPVVGAEGTLGMAYLDTGDSGRRFEQQELDLLIAILNVAGRQLDAVFAHQARQRAALVAGEVSVAHAIQARITPRKLPQWNELQWGAFREPGRERSSDVYDVIKLSNQQAGFMVAHTSALGPLPSLLMAQAQATFRAACMHQDSPHVFMRMMNHLLYDGQPDHPLDCCMGLLDPVSGELRYAIAGWMGAYIINPRGEERRLGEPAPPGQRAATPALGTEKAATYTTLTETLSAGESLVVYTPGVTTARNRNDDAFGEDRFINILCDGFGQLASAMLKEMLSDLQGFTEGGKQPDDITVLLTHRVQP